MSYVNPPILFLVTPTIAFDGDTRDLTRVASGFFQSVGNGLRPLDELAVEKADFAVARVHGPHGQVMRHGINKAIEIACLEYTAHS